MALLRAVARAKVPIVYLTAAYRGPSNKPRGAGGRAAAPPESSISAWQRVSARFAVRPPRTDPSEQKKKNASAHDDNHEPNGEFKGKVLRRMRQRYPKAVFYCLGDNDTHDAVASGAKRDRPAPPAYCGCDHCFIRKIRPWTADNRPGPAQCCTILRGRTYTATVIDHVLSVLGSTRRRSSRRRR